MPKLSLKERAQQLRAQAAALESRAKDADRKRENRAKIVLGGGVMAAIRAGRLDKAQILAAIEPALREQDRQALTQIFE